MDTSDDTQSNTADTSFSSSSSSGQPVGYVRIKGVDYLPVEHPANIRKGTNVSWIWKHGRELRDAEEHRVWQCQECSRGNITTYNIDSTNYKVSQHLKKKHRLIKPGEEEDEDLPQSNIGALVSVAAKKTAGLVTSLSIERFRYLLIRWIVLCHLALSIIEHEAFRTLVKYISPAIEHYLVKSGDTIRQWIIDEFGKQ